MLIIFKFNIPLFFEDGLKINKLSEWFIYHSSIPSISWIFRLPFLTSLWSSNPRKYYQKWCKALDGYFTNEEKKKIIEEDDAAGAERDFWADTIWTLMEMQRNYIPILFELKYILKDIFEKPKKEQLKREEYSEDWYTKMLDDIEKSLDEKESQENS